MPVQINAAIRRYAGKTKQALPKEPGPKVHVPNTGEAKWLKAWTRLYPDVPLTMQARFYIEGHRNPFRMDFLHEATKVVVEISGGVHSISKIRRRDYMRSRWLQDHGYAVYQFDPADLTIKAVDGLCKQVHDAITRRLLASTETP